MQRTINLLECVVYFLLRLFLAPNGVSHISHASPLVRDTYVHAAHWTPSPVVALSLSSDPDDTAKSLVMSEP